MGTGQMAVKNVRMTCLFTCTPPVAAKTYLSAMQTTGAVLLGRQLLLTPLGSA